MGRDESVLPWESAERPTPKTLLQEQLEGQQLSRLHYLDAIGPTGSRGLALELTTGAKLLVFAGRDRVSAFTARLFFRWLDPPLIILPRMARAFSGGREADIAAGPPDELQRAVEGEVIHGIIHSKQSTRQGGETMAIEFRGSLRLHVTAEPCMRMTPEGELQSADIAWVLTERERRVIVMP